jgi:hypothetical protein
LTRKTLCKDLLQRSSDDGISNAPAFATQQNQSSDETVAHSNKKPKYGGSDQRAVFFMFYPVMQTALRVMEAIKRQFDAHLGVTQAMPHILLPIGTNRQGVLSVMMDSCAGLNLGKLSYHKSIYDARPDLVHQFAFIKDLNNVSEFDISGVDHHGPGLKVTALITYKTPFRLKGVPVFVSFALTEGAAANSIIGLPFLRATRTAMFMEEDGQDTIVVQKLSTTFKVSYHPPLIGEQAPQSDHKSQASYGYAPLPPDLARGTESVRAQLAQVVTPSVKNDDNPEDIADAPVTTSCPVFIPATIFEHNEYTTSTWQE